jgi:CBS domain containing-hemolysin-like protein
VRSRQLVESGGAGARLLGIWVRHPERVRATLTVGGTLVTVGFGALALALAVAHGEAGAIGPWALVVPVLVAAALLLVLGQLVPRVVARRFPVRTALVTIPLVHVVAWVLWPAAALVERLGRFLSTRLGKGEAAPGVTTDQIEYLIEVGTREGAFDAVREELLNSVLEFADRVVREVMVPRTRVAALDRDAPPDAVLKLLTENPYSRMPVYQGTVDNVVGVLLVRDLIPELSRGAKSVPIDRFMKAPFFVPEQMKISRLLKEMQRKKVHLAVVVDEFGGTSGIVTLEDVIEEIVGEIQDEADAEAAPIRALPGGGWLADASVPLRDLEEFLAAQAGGDEQGAIRFPDEGEYETLAGFVTATAGRVPAAGSQIDWDGLSFTVRAADERRVLKVEIARREAPPEAALPQAAEQGT